MIMDIQTLTIIIACVALALALEATILIVWFTKKMSMQMVTFHEKMTQLKEYLTQKDVQQTTLTDLPKEVVVEPKAETVLTPPDPLLEQAYNTFYLRYRQLASETTVDNLDEKSQELACQLLEMGYWLKDYLPVWHHDFNATSVQKVNVESITLDDEHWQQTHAQAPLPTTNPYKTSFEVIALVQKLHQWGVEQFRFLISGFRYQNQSIEL